MPASFLCDRATTLVAKEQPGFCNYIIIPMWNLVQQTMPAMESSYNKAQENVVSWQIYKETESDCQVYEVKECAYKTRTIQQNKKNAENQTKQLTAAG